MVFYALVRLLVCIRHHHARDAMRRVRGARGVCVCAQHSNGMPTCVFSCGDRVWTWTMERSRLALVTYGLPA